MYKLTYLALAMLFPVLAWSADKPSTDFALLQYVLDTANGQIDVMQVAMTDAGKARCESNLSDLATGLKQSAGDKAKVVMQECVTELPETIKALLDRKPIEGTYYVWWKPDAHDVAFTLYGGLDSKDPKAVCDYLMQQPPAPDAKCVAPPAAAAKP